MVLWLYFSFGTFVNFYDFFLFTIEVTVLSKLSCVRNRCLVLRLLVLLKIFTRFVVCTNSPKTENQKIHKDYVIFILQACRFKAKTQSDYQNDKKYLVRIFCVSRTILTNRRFRYFNFCHIFIMKNKGTPPFRYFRNPFNRFSQVLWLFD